MTAVAIAELQPTRRRPLTPWELPTLLIPMHTYRRGRKKWVVERPHFASILAFIHRNHMAVSSQVQRRFADVIRSDRTARRHLAELEALGFVSVVPARGTSPLFPKVYVVNRRGLRRLEAHYAAAGKTWPNAVRDRRSRHTQEGYAAGQVIHEVLTTEFLLAVWQTIEGRPDLELLTTQRRSLVRHPAFRVSLDGRAGRLIPDALFVFRQGGGGMMCCMLEMDLGSMTLRQIHRKLRRYAAWSHTEVGQEYLKATYRRYGAVDPKPSFRILFVAHDRTHTDDRRRMLEIMQVAQMLPRDLRDRVWFTTVADILCHQHEPLPLDTGLWFRARDVAGRNALPEGPLRQAAKAALEVVLPSLPRHPLFPWPVAHSAAEAKETTAIQASAP